MGVSIVEKRRSCNRLFSQWKLPDWIDGIFILTQASVESGWTSWYGIYIDYVSWFVMTYCTILVRPECGPAARDLGAMLSHFSWRNRHERRSPVIGPIDRDGRTDRPGGNLPEKCTVYCTHACRGWVAPATDHVGCPLAPLMYAKNLVISSKRLCSTTD